MWIAALALVAATYLLVETSPASPVALATGVLVPSVAAAAVIVDWAAAGWWTSFVTSLRSLTGLTGPGEVVPSGCTTFGQGGHRVVQVFVVLLLLAVAVVAVVPAVAGVLGVPAGVAAAAGGGVLVAVKRDAEFLQFGLRILLGALAGLVVAALVLRGLHVGYTAVMCPAAAS